MCGGETMMLMMMIQINDDKVHDRQELRRRRSDRYKREEELTLLTF
jgi:hypothetical protein